jgi:hypothetical protein
MNAIGATLWHQSQEATDCRWFRVMAQVIAGKFHIPQEIAKDWFGYPHEGDQRSVRPFIRASEIAPSSLNPPDMAWPNAFWHEGLANTPCMTLKTEKPDGPIEVGLTRQRLHKVTDLLRSHWHVTHQTTSIDARHDGSFGMAFYSLAILEELLGIGVSTGIIGRLGLRTILETHINLKFLHLKGDLELWKKWRSYGAGQAKLSSLKFDGMVAAPKHIDLASLEQIANEDFWRNSSQSTWQAGVAVICVALASKLMQRQSTTSFMDGLQAMPMRCGGRFANHVSRPAGIRCIVFIAIQTTILCLTLSMTQHFSLMEYSNRLI